MPFDMTGKTPAILSFAEQTFLGEWACALLDEHFYTALGEGLSMVDAARMRGFGELLQRYRHRAGLTQKELAERAEMSPRGLIYLERGERYPQLGTARRLADALGLDGSERESFLTKSEDPRIKEAAPPEPVAGRPETAGIEREHAGEVCLGPLSSPAGKDNPNQKLLVFLLADIRGYTSYTREHGNEAAARLTMIFASMVRQGVSNHHGNLVELRGDEALATFESARDAVTAALALQERFAEAIQEDLTLPLKVGIGLDAGDAVPVEGGYRGGALNLAARLCSLAGSGDILVTESVLRLAGTLPGMVYADRGLVSLKGIPDRVRVLQIGREGVLPLHLPPLQTKVRVPPSNLPAAVTSFVDREEEVAEISSLLQQDVVRLVTLTGPGGTGKTRLALQVATTNLDSFADGAFFVPLAPIQSPDIVPSAVAMALSVHQSGGRSIEDEVLDYLRDKHLLLVLDNFEHLMDAIPFVRDLLDSCRQVRVLATSRAALRLSYEHEYRVDPLPVPNVTRQVPPDQLENVPAVRLFADRARSVRRDFTITRDNAQAVAEICARLDGLPLALELAAARTRIFPPQSLLSRLSSRLAVLKSGTRDSPERQQTLRAAIDWSYHLLAPAERQLFADLSVFAGGCTLEAMEAVTVSHPGADFDTIDAAESLVTQSLLRQEGEEEPRFSMLQTIREYAAEQLQLSGLQDGVQERHAYYFSELAREAEPQLRGADQRQWLDRLEAAHDDLRAALTWLIDHQCQDAALAMTVSLWRFWWSRGHLSEGREWLRRALLLGSDTLALRARALNAAGSLAWSQGDIAEAENQYRESLELHQRLGDRRGESLSLSNLGLIAEQRGDYKQAARLYGAGLAVVREYGDSWYTAAMLGNLGGALLNLGDYASAEQANSESLQLWRSIGDRVSAARILNNLALLAMESGDLRNAAERQVEALHICVETGNRENLAVCMEGAAAVLSATRHFVEACRVWGAAETVRQSLGQLPSPGSADLHELYVSLARAHLNSGSFERAWKEGSDAAISDIHQLVMEQLQAIATGNY